MTSFKLQALSLGAVLSLLSGAATAAASSSATLSNLSIRLIDLDTSDGIAPGITFKSNDYGPNGNRAFAQAITQGSVYTIYGDEQRSAGDLILAGASELASVSSSVSASLVTGPNSLKSAGTASGVHDSGTHSHYFSTASNGYDFSLTANTLAVFSVVVDMEVYTTVGGHPHSSNNEGSRAEYSMRAFRSIYGGISQSSSIFRSAQADYTLSYVHDPVTGVSTPVFSPQSFSFNATFELPFVNQSDAAITGSFEASTTAWGASYVSGVPEPEAPLLALGGACLVAWAKRSRNSRHPRSDR